MRHTTKTVLPLVVLLVSASIVATGTAEPTLPQKSQAQTNGSGVLQGQLLKIEGESYVVKDATGKDIRFRVGKDTVVDGRIKVGDKIDAQMGADGQAVTVLKALE
jgi:hypothetical protein